MRLRDDTDLNMALKENCATIQRSKPLLHDDPVPIWKQGVKAMQTLQAQTLPTAQGIQQRDDLWQRVSTVWQAEHVIQLLIMRVDPTSITSSISGQNILVNTLFFYEDLKISNHNQHTFMNMFINLYFFHYPLSVSCLNVRDEAFRLNNVQNLNFFYFKIEEI